MHETEEYGRPAEASIDNGELVMMTIPAASEEKEPSLKCVTRFLQTLHHELLQGSVQKSSQCITTFNLLLAYEDLLTLFFWLVRCERAFSKLKLARRDSESH